jgi:dephospho-CoA kinase
MIVLGLTGSIGMGKSTTASMFAEAGARVWDADAAVHRLYGPGGAAVPAIGALVPEAASDIGVDRDKLRAAILADDTLLPRVEAAVHPLVKADRDAFVAAARAEGAPLVVCDIPLLFETGDPAAFDAVVVVTAPAEVQRARVLARPGMTEAALDRILARQMPDAEKRARADHVIDTGAGLDSARAAVLSVIDKATGGSHA